MDWNGQYRFAVASGELRDAGNLMIIETHPTLPRIGTDLDAHPTVRPIGTDLDAHPTLLPIGTDLDAHPTVPRIGTDLLQLI